MKVQVAPAKTEQAFDQMRRTSGYEHQPFSVRI
jgi:hypothetical protein